MPRKQRYHTISYQAARELVWSQRINGGGRIFSIAFERAADSADGHRHKGDLEVVYARFNVKKHCKTLQNCCGGWTHPDGIIRRYWAQGARPLGAAYDRAEKDVCCVYVVGGKNRYQRSGECGYRSIRFGSIRWLKLDGIIYRVGLPPAKQH